MTSVTAPPIASDTLSILTGSVNAADMAIAGQISKAPKTGTMVFFMSSNVRTKGRAHFAERDRLFRRMVTGR